MAPKFMVIIGRVGAALFYLFLFLFLYFFLSLLSQLYFNVPAPIFIIVFGFGLSLMHAQAVHSLGKKIAPTSLPLVGDREKKVKLR